MSKDNEPISIRLSDIIRFIRKYFLFFLIVGVVSAIGGYLASYLRQNKYTAYARLLPEQNPSATGSLSELVSLAGIAARNRSEALRPDLYPDILSSNQFALRLLTTPLKDQEGNKVTLFDFFQANSEVEDKAPAFKKEQIDGIESPLLLDRSQQILIDIARGCVSASYGKIDGVISISVELRDPVLAAEIVQYSISYLTEFVTSYRLDKAIAKVNLLEQQSERAGSEYRNALSQLSSFRDRNRNLFTYSSRTDEIRLDGDVLRTQNIFNGGIFLNKKKNIY